MKDFREFHRDDRFISPAPLSSAMRPLLKALAGLVAVLVGAGIAWALCSEIPKWEAALVMEWGLMVMVRG